MLDAIQIAIIGSQSTGKTTLANGYIDHMKSLDRDCWVTDDGCARAVAKKGTVINEAGTYVTQIEIARELVNRFQPGVNKGESSVCYSPRVIRVSTLVRFWAYMKYVVNFNINSTTADIATMNVLHEWALYELYSVFHEIIYLPIEFKPVEDGVRSIDSKYQYTIDCYIAEILKESGVKYHTIKGDVQQRFERLRSILFRYYTGG